MDTITFEQRLEDIKIEKIGPAIEALLIDVVGEGVVVKGMTDYPSSESIVYVGIPDVKRAIIVNIDSILADMVDVDEYDMTLADLESHFSEGYIPTPKEMTLQRCSSYKDAFRKVLNILQINGIPLRIN